MRTELIDEGGVVRVDVGTSMAARLFGLPFMLIGGYLAYQLAGGLVDLATGRAALSEMLVGTILLAIVTAAFLVPGWLLMFSKARVEIDRNTRTVTYVRDLRVYQHAEKRALSEFDRVEVDLLSVAPNRQSRGRAYQVELAGRHRRNVVVGLLDDGDEALTFARRIGALIGLPVNDRRDVERAETD